MIIRAIDVTFDLIHRRDATDVVLATVTRHFEPQADNTDEAQACDLDLPAPAVDFEPGDQFIFRYTGVAGGEPIAYIPNGDGALTRGRIPNITLPR